jgi:hypothetical protein
MFMTKVFPANNPLNHACRSLCIAVATATATAMTMTMTGATWGQQPPARRLPPPATTVETSGDSPTTKILFIGQSIFMAYNTPHIFHFLAKSKRPQEQFLVEMVAGGGYSLKDHYEDGTALREIKKQRWNYVIIQESTANQIINHKPYEQYAPFFDQEARKVGAQPLQFECYDDSPNEDCPMHKEVIKVANMVHEPVIPVGSVWRYVTKYYPNIPILSRDFHHPSALGSYLIACVLYSRIYKEPSEGAQVSFEYSNPITRRQSVLDTTTNPNTKILEKASWAVVKALP